jgi:heme exporter protein CcmD
MNLAAAHDGYVFAAYGITAAVTAGLILWAVWRHRSTRRALARLEARLGERRP